MNQQQLQEQEVFDIKFIIELPNGNKLIEMILSNTEMLLEARQYLQQHVDSCEITSYHFETVDKKVINEFQSIMELGYFTKDIYLTNKEKKKKKKK